ncbi:hypothetical protein AB0C99_03265, partial [Streptomyces sp. NPDC048659]
TRARTPRRPPGSLRTAHTRRIPAHGHGPVGAGGGGSAETTTTNTDDGSVFGVGSALAAGLAGTAGLILIRRARRRNDGAA